MSEGKLYKVRIFASYTSDNGLISESISYPPKKNPKDLKTQMTQFKNETWEMSIVSHTFNKSTPEEKGGGSLWFEEQPGLHCEF